MHLVAVSQANKRSAPREASPVELVGGDRIFIDPPLALDHGFGRGLQLEVCTYPNNLTCSEIADGPIGGALFACLRASFK